MTDSGEMQPTPENHQTAWSSFTPWEKTRFISGLAILAAGQAEVFNVVMSTGVLEGLPQIVAADAIGVGIGGGLVWSIPEMRQRVGRQIQQLRSFFDRS